ncbi:MAG: hypothetical protein ABL986_19620 [Vicinamibacterales bacterium]
MHRLIGSVVALSLFALAAGVSPTQAQTPTPTLAVGPVLDIMGQWSGNAGTMEEQPLRGDPGVEVGEYVGMPINAAARLHADSWQPTWGSLPEWQNRPHPVTYSMRAPSGNFRLTAEYDPVYQNLVAYHIDGLFGRADRVVWMDGRQRPSKYAEHLYQGFSLGAWENGVLKIVTTHIKYAFIHRNGLPTSPYAVVTEYYVPHGDLLTGFYIVDDPIYLTEPLIRTTSYRRAPQQNTGRALPSEVVEELATLKRGEVPAYPLGTKHREYSETHKIPFEATQGGAETALPEYMKRIQELLKAEKPAAPSSQQE